MDDLSFTSAEAVPPIPLADGALPPSSAALPRSAAPNLTLPIGVTTKVASKPGRYEDGLDTRPLTPPSSSHNLQLVFDSSKIYDNHPRKYRLLLETDKDNDSHTSHLFESASSSSDATTSPSVTVEDGRVVAMGTTSSGPVEVPSPMPDAGVAAGVPKLGSTSTPSQGAPFTLSEAVSSVSVKKEQGQSRYVPQEFLQSFTAATKLGPPSDQESRKRALPLSGPSSSAEMPPSIEMPSAGIIHPSTAPIPQIHAPERHEMPSGCVVVQPEPRRLFGFGPFYRPLPETHCVPGGRRQSSPTLTVPGGLSEAVTKEGITAAGHPGGRRASAAVDSTDSGGVGVAAGVTTGTAAGVNKRVGGHKKPPTPAELNVWLGGSF